MFFFSSKKRKEKKYKKAEDSPFLGVAADLLNVGYKMYQAYCFDRGGLYLVPQYHSRKFSGFTVMVCTFDPPTENDEAFMSNFLSKNNMSGNWKASVNDQGNRFFKANLADLGDMACEWPYFCDCAWEKFKSKNPNCTVLGDSSNIKYVLF